MTLNTQSLRSATRFRPLLTGLGLITVSWTTVMPAAAQVIVKGPVIYQGEPSASSGIKLGSWGSGTILEDNKGTFGGGSMSLRIVTHGFYQGASLQLGKTVDLGPYIDNKYAYLSFVVAPPPPPNPATSSFGGTGSPSSGKGAGRGPSGGGAAGSGGYPGEGGGSENSGSSGGSFGGRGENGGLKSTSLAVKYQTPHAMQNIRIVLVTSTGRSLEALLPLDSATDEGLWKRVSIPVSVIPGLKAEDSRIKEIRMFGDTPGVLRVGNISVMIDDNPLTIDSLPSRDLARLAMHEFRVVAHGGITPLVVSWDWDASDGIQEEVQGRFVTHQFRKESVYDRDTNKILDNVVTVTVRDLYGIKKPVTTKFAIHVTP